MKSEKTEEGRFCPVMAIHTENLIDFDQKRQDVTHTITVTISGSTQAEVDQESKDIERFIVARMEAVFARREAMEKEAASA